MTNRFYLLLSFIIIPLWLGAQTGNTSGENAFSLGIGGASIGLTGIYGMQGNQASIIEGRDLEILLSSERRFWLSDLSSVSLAAKKNFGFGAIGVLVESFGLEEYKEQKLGLAYARRLTNKLSIGAQFDLLNLNIDRYGSRSVYTFELGLYSKINKYFHASAHVFSPGQISVTENTDLPTIFRTGIKYLPSKKLNLLLEFNKSLEEKFDFRMGLSYQIIDLLNFRVGFATEPSLFTFGFGIKITDNLIIDGGNSFHQLLGNTPGVSLKYRGSQ